MAAKIDSVSAFFIDTAARLDKRPYIESNAGTIVVKTALLFASLALSARILYGGQASVDKTLHKSPLVKACDKWRRRITMVASSVFVARVLIQMALFWHRRISWIEVIAEAGFIIPLSLASLAWGAVRRRHELVGWRELIGIVVFVAGTYLNIGSEGERYLWKQDSANQRRLYTLGLWQYARHINYGGEIVSFAGLALWCQDWNFWIPIAMWVGMAGFSVPEIDFYLASRYAEEWPSYVEEVRWNMLPFVW